MKWCWGLTLHVRQMDPDWQIGKILSEDGIWLFRLDQRKSSSHSRGFLQCLDLVHWSYFEKKEEEMAYDLSEKHLWRSIDSFERERSFWSPSCMETTSFQLRLLKLMHQIPSGPVSEIFVEQVSSKVFLKFVFSLLDSFESQVKNSTQAATKQLADLMLSLFIVKTMRALGCLDLDALQSYQQEGVCSKKALIAFLLQTQHPKDVLKIEVMDANMRILIADALHQLKTYWHEALS